MRGRRQWNEFGAAPYLGHAAAARCCCRPRAGLRAVGCAVVRTLLQAVPSWDVIAVPAGVELSANAGPIALADITPTLAATLGLAPSKVGARIFALFSQFAHWASDFRD